MKLYLGSLVIALLISLPCWGQMPPAPGATSGSGDNGMKHSSVTMPGFVVGVSLPTSPASPVTMTDVGFGTNYPETRFDVLEDVYFNAQHGWVPDGFINLPVDRFFWIERIAVTQPAGSTFKVYEGGNMGDMGTWTMNEVYTVQDPIWQWDGAMQHDYFTADKVGDYSMSFKVYVGDDLGVADTAYTSASTTFEFQVVPEPAGLALMLLATAALVTRRT